MRQTLISEDKLLDALRQLAKKLGTDNISKSLVDADPDTFSSSTYQRAFGSWGKAVSLAGLKTGKITGRPWDKPIVISNEAMEIIDGELLGDGGLEPTSASKNPGFSHSTANFHYSIFLEQTLVTAGIDIHIEILPPRKDNSNLQRRIRTQNNQSFMPLLKRWYPQGVKIVPGDIILTKIKCLHWYLGDGYIEGKRAKVSTCGFRWDEVQRLATMMEVLGFSASVERHSGGYPVLRFSPTDSIAFLNWLGPCPVIGYEHRWALVGG